MDDKILKIIFDLVKKIGAKNNIPDLINPQLETGLYGMSGNLDSLTLVYLAVNLEDLISEEFGVEVTLVDDKAISQKNSPFKTIQSLKDYILELLSS